MDRFSTARALLVRLGSLLPLLVLLAAPVLAFQGDPPPSAAFTPSETSGDAPLSVTFADDSTGEVDTWAWDFGDGNTSPDPSPVHVYTAAGTYTVTLDVTGPGGSDQFVQAELIQVSRAPMLWFVDESAVGGLGDGTSWPDAFLNLNDALAAAGEGDTIRIANGSYRPDEGGGATAGDRDASFAVAQDVILEGGYVGFGAVDPNLRNPADHRTVLDGDLSGNDGADFAQTGDNSRLILAHTGGSLTLDGLTVRGGFNDSEASSNVLTQSGSGLVAHELAQDLTVRNCLFESNLSLGGSLVAGGGGSLAAVELAGDLTVEDTLFFHNRIENSVGRTAFGGAASVLGVAGDVLFSSCDFESNDILITGGSLFSQARGGALFVAEPATGSARIEDCRFFGNSAVCSNGASGGGCESESATLLRCRFEDNLVDGGQAQGLGGGSWGGAALFECWFLGNRAQGDGLGAGGGLTVLQAEVHSCVVLGNSASDSPGGLHVFGLGGAVISHCTIAENVAEGSNDGRSVGGLQDATILSLGPDSIQHCLLWGNLNEDSETEEDAQLFLSPGVPIDHSSVQGIGAALEGTANDDVDPLLRDALGPDGIGGTGDEDPRLAADSPAIEGGDNASVVVDAFDSDGDLDLLESAPFDAVGTARISDGDSDGVADVDRGALEAPNLVEDLDLDVGATVTLLPLGGLGDPLLEPVLEIENLTDLDDASVTASAAPAIPATLLTDAALYGSVLSTASSLLPGDLVSTVSVPFTAADLGGADPTTVATRIELHGFDPATGQLALAVDSNTQNSPGFTTPEGDYTIELGPSAPVLSLDLGDHGIFWDPVLEQGFAWARVDFTGDFTPRLFVDCNGNGLSDDEELSSGFSVDANEDGVLDACQDLVLRADVTTLSVSAGGAQRFELDAIDAAPGAIRFYLVIASASGTAPGLPVDGVLLPLNFDPLLNASLASANGAIWQTTFGVLPQNGQASASLNLPPGALNPALAGTSLHHAALILALNPDLFVAGASNAVLLDFVP